MGVEVLALGATLFVFTLFQQLAVQPFLTGWNSDVRKSWIGRLIYLLTYESSFVLAGTTAKRLLSIIGVQSGIDIGSGLLLCVGVWSVFQSWPAARRGMETRPEPPYGSGYPFVLMAGAMEAYATGFGVAQIAGTITGFAIGVAAALLIGLATRVRRRVGHTVRTFLNSGAAMSGLLLVAFSLFR